MLYKTMPKEEQEKLISAAMGLIEFAERQAQEGLVDGAFDPDVYLREAKRITSQYAVKFGYADYSMAM